MNENIVRLSEADTTMLIESAMAAQERGGTIRVCTGLDAKGRWFKFDAGYGWTPPLRSQDY